MQRNILQSNVGGKSEREALDIIDSKDEQCRFNRKTTREDSVKSKRTKESTELDSTKESTEIEPNLLLLEKIKRKKKRAKVATKK